MKILNYGWNSLNTHTYKIFLLQQHVCPRQYVCMLQCKLQHSLIVTIFTSVPFLKECAVYHWTFYKHIPIKHHHHTIAVVSHVYVFIGHTFHMFIYYLTIFHLTIILLTSAFFVLIFKWFVMFFVYFCCCCCACVCACLCVWCVWVGGWVCDPLNEVHC